MSLLNDQNSSNLHLLFLDFSLVATETRSNKVAYPYCLKFHFFHIFAWFHEGLFLNFELLAVY